MTLLHRAEPSPRLQQAARALLAARESRTPLAAAPDRLGRLDMAEAYAVQQLVATALGPVGAWKVGGPSPDAEPVTAPIPAARVWQSPATPPAGSLRLFGIEAEIAYRFGRDLPARDETYTDEEVLAAVNAVLPTIEIVDTCLAEGLDADPAWKLADRQINGGLVVGAPVRIWRNVEPATQPIRLSVNGSRVHAGKGGNPAGDPARLLVWLANALGDHCGGLRAGQIVTTGSLSGIRFVDPGAEVVAEMAGLGSVEIELPG